MKQLAVVGRVVRIDTIFGADEILLATAVISGLGRFTSIVDKDVKLYGLATVFMPGSVLPAEDKYSFMKPYGYRVKPIRLKRVVSECLILKVGGEEAVGEGADRTAELGVKLFEKKKPTRVRYPKTAKPVRTIQRGVAVPAFGSVRSMLPRTFLFRLADGVIYCHRG